MDALGLGDLQDGLALFRLDFLSVVVMDIMICPTSSDGCLRSPAGRLFSVI